MTYIIVKTFAQVGYVIYILFLSGSYEQHKSHFLFLMLISVKRQFNVIWLVIYGLLANDGIRQP